MVHRISPPPRIRSFLEKTYPFECSKHVREKINAGRGTNREVTPRLRLNRLGCMPAISVPDYAKCSRRIAYKISTLASLLFVPPQNRGSSLHPSLDPPIGATTNWLQSMKSKILCTMLDLPKYEKALSPDAAAWSSYLFRLDLTNSKIVIMSAV